MSVFLKKSTSAGPVRFNLSKSEVRMLTTLKGSQACIGKREVGVSGDRKAVFLRKVVTTSDSFNPQLEKSVQSRSTEEKGKANRLSLGPPLIPIFLGILSIGLLFISVYAFALGLLVAGLAFWRYTEKVKRYTRHERALAKLTRFQDPGLLRFLQRSIAGLPRAHWEGRHRFIYEEIFEAALEDEMDTEEMTWLKQVSAVLGVDAQPIHEAKIKERMWGAIADGTVADEEEETIHELLAICELQAERFQKETSAFRQFIAARPIRKGTLPRAETGVNLPEDELCHHQTSGCLLEKKTIRTSGVKGEGREEERLAVSKEGKIYITSKRVLIVGDVTTSIPHEKILDAEIDPDNNVISIIKDAMREPLLLRAQDLIYTGILLEAVATAASRYFIRPS